MPELPVLFRPWPARTAPTAISLSDRADDQIFREVAECPPARSALLLMSNALKRSMMIGLLTMHHSYNYGAALQAFALCETIVEMGHEVEIIDLRATYNKMYEDEATQYIIKRRPPGIVNLHRSEYQQKAELFTSFFDTYMSRTERADAPGDIDAISQRFDALVVGSDEVWTLKYGWNPNYFLTFGSEGIGRISYAASFGRTTDVGQFRHELGAALSHFDTVLVRDHNSQKIVRDITGVMPPLSIDPVLLGSLGRLDVPTMPTRDASPLILVYAEHQLFPSQVAAIRRAAREGGARIVAVGYPHWFADESVIAAGPLEFIELVRASSMVVSSLFHGVVFGLAYEKQLMILPSKKKRLKVESLLKQTGLTELYGDLDGITIDYAVTGPVLEELRTRSRDLLCDALDGVMARRAKG